MFKKARAVAVLSVAGLGAALIVGSPALASPGGAAQGSFVGTGTGDVVGVGSDTIQFGGDFLADGSTSDPGYNGAGNKWRMVNYDATGDEAMLIAASLNGTNESRIKAMPFSYLNLVMMNGV